MTGDKESMNIGYAPQFMSIAHLNNPKAHREDLKEAPQFDVLKSAYKLR